MPARAPPVRAPELDLDAPADDDDLEFDLTRERGSEQPWDSPLHEPVQAELGQSEAPVASVAAGAAMTRPTSAAHPTSLAPKATSVAPPGAVLDLGLESSAWDLDDELGDPRAAQLNVAVPLPAKDDGPWPTARTPLPESLSVSAADIERTLALAPPGGFPSSPLYFWSARGALRRLETEAAQAVRQLTSAEHERDALLAELGQALRPTLAKLDRFRAACDQVDQHERVVREARAALGQADNQGETGLAQVDAELESAKATVVLRMSDAEERRQAAEGAERDVARLRAAHQRHVIERRNIVARAQETAGPGANMPPELAGRFLAAEEQIKRSEAELNGAMEGHRQLESQLRLAEEEQRRALAHVRRVEGKREGLVLTQQGTLGDLNETLQRAERGYQEALAGLGLAAIELRGEVPVGPEVRGRLLDLDRTVTTRALALERLRRAQASVDLVAYGQGRLVLGLIALVVLVLLAWLLARSA